MRKHCSFIGIVLLVTMSAPFSVYAQSSASPQEREMSCKEQVKNRLADVVDEYHRVLYGSTGATLTDDGKTVVKIGGTLDEPDLPGIFETKGRLTSELVPPLLDSYRVLRCNLRAVCEQLSGTLQHGKSPPMMAVEPLGCAEREMPAMDQCTSTEELGLLHTEVLNAYCDDVINKTLPVERSALTLAVSYDAGYRSNLQTIGMFDSFLKLLPTHLFRPFQQMVGLLGKIHQIPCFLTQCDAPPNP